MWKVTDRLARETNRYIYNRLYKRWLESRFINCDRCPFHRGENASRQPKHRSWKELRKTQYKGG